MPVKNGEDAAREIRAVDREDAMTIPIIALTADITPDLEERCRDAGIDNIVSKPIDSSRLFSILAEAFQRKN